MKFTKIPESTFQMLQLNAGVLLSSFDPTAPAVVDSAILGATSGGINFSASQSFLDFGADIDNCPKNTKQLKRLEDWDIKLTGSFATVNAALVERLVGVGDLASNKVTPRRDVQLSDFRDLWWVGDYSDMNGENGGGFVAIHMMSTLSTGGFQAQSADKEKTKFSFEFTAHFSMDAQDTVPFEIYVQAGSDAPGISLGASEIEVAVGSTYTLTESHYPAANSVTWASSATATATVSNGVVEGKAAGYCVVTASITVSGSPNVTYTDACLVHVVAAS